MLSVKSVLIISKRLQKVLALINKYFDRTERTVGTYSMSCGLESSLSHVYVLKS